jgi:replicative DNA helicase
MENPMNYPLEIERMMLAALLNDIEAYPQIASLITEASFHLESHRKIFKAISAIAGRREPIDPMSVQNELARSGDLLVIGGSEYLAELAAGIPLVTEVTYLAQILYEYQIRRSMIELVAGSHESLLHPVTDVAMELFCLPLAIEELEMGSAFAAYQSLYDQRAIAIRECVERLESRAGD